MNKTSTYIYICVCVKVFNLLQYVKFFEFEHFLRSQLG